MSTRAAPGVQLDAFKLGMSRLAAGVCVIATGSAEAPGDWRGMTATSVCSLCADPPSLVACVDRGTGTYREVLRNGAFSVNVLTSSDVGTARTFAGRRGAFGAERFASGEWSPGELGAPVLLGALVSFECRLSRTVEHATHALLIGGIEAIVHGTRTGHEMPLVYQSRRYRDLGAEVEEAGGTPR
jgi:flavin reductase (DIM6/NTAB) family NADH-FMN oxidoreductase RutF